MSVRKSNYSVSRGVFLFFFLLSGTTGPLWAVQPHGGLEGVVSHEIGHVLFIIGTIFLLVRSRLSHWSGPGWKEFKIFLWLVLFWNFLTFTGHWQSLYIEPEKYLRLNGLVEAFHIRTPFDFLFYVTRLDHILFLPAIFYLFLALRNWALKNGRNQ